MKLIEIILSLLVTPVFAAQTFTVEDVAKHDSTDDCYMIFEDKVYNFTDYLDEHDDYYYNIDSWCGKDMTKDFQTKDGRGQDHKSRSYAMLENYYVGDLVSNTSTTTGSLENSGEVIDDTVQTEAKTSSPYNFAIPFFGTLSVYFITEVLVKLGKYKKDWKFNKIAEKFFWNTVLLVSLIPSAIFGFYLVLRFSIPALRDINFDFLYWHVEGSIVFGTVCVIHFIERIKTYFAQTHSFMK